MWSMMCFWSRLNSSNELNVDKIEVVEERLEFKQRDRVTIIQIFIHPLLSLDPTRDASLQPFFPSILFPVIFVWSLILDSQSNPHDQSPVHVLVRRWRWWRPHVVVCHVWSDQRQKAGHPTRIIQLNPSSWKWKLECKHDWSFSALSIQWEWRFKSKNQR